MNSHAIAGCALRIGRSPPWQDALLAGWNFLFAVDAAAATVHACETGSYWLHWLLLTLLVSFLCIVYFQWPAAFLLPLPLIQSAFFLLRRTLLLRSPISPPGLLSEQQ
jgi:hypothetical protein